MIEIISFITEGRMIDSKQFTPLEVNVDIIKTDVAIIGAGGAGLRAAIAVAETNPELEIALISKVYPMRSHTVAAEGGAAGVVQAHDSLETSTRALIDAANDAGGKDNISVILARASGGASAPAWSWWPFKR